MLLLGRDRELERLSALLDGARAGDSGVLALVGEAGIGKTTLLEGTAALADGMRVLRARGVESEAQIPFAGLFELLRPALGSLDRIPPPQAAALESALALRPARAEDRFAVGAATLTLLAAHAEEAPLLVLVDDAHRLDGSSADALLFAARRLVADPIAVVLAVREGEPSLLDGADLEVVRVGGLDAEAAALLVRREDPAAAEETAARLHRETGGNPLALLELARERPAQVPLEAPLPIATSVSETYAQRAAALPERTRDALLLAAATDRGEPALFARAGAALGLVPEDLAPAEAAGLVAVRDGRLEFRHALARSAVYAAADPADRRAVHRALADALPDADADRRAWHLALAAAGPDERASSALAQAGVRARDRSAYDVASQAYERAARLAPEDEPRGLLLYAAADAAWLGGLPERAVVLLSEAERFATERLLPEIGYLRGQIALRRGPLGEGRRVLLAAAADAGPERAVVMLAEAAFGAFYAADAGGVAECGARVRALALSNADPRTAFFAAMTHGMAEVLAGDGEAGATAIRGAVALLERTNELSDDPRLLVWVSVGPLWLREAWLARDLVDRALAAARERSAAGILPHLLAHVAIAYVAADRWVEAQAAFDEAIALARETGQRVVLAGALARCAWLEARLGRESSCRAHAHEALTLARELGVVLVELWSVAALGELELQRGDVAAALGRFGEQQELCDRQALTDADLSPVPEQVELLLRRGEQRAAETAAAAYERAAAAKDQPWALARASRCRALLADDFEGAFEDALARHAQTPDVFEAARTRLAYGARLRRAGRRSDAREQLRAALDAFDSLGAHPWADAARVELAATGETARRRDPSTLDELTPQELQVALLLAGGKTTREAAAALFLSPKTVEYHLRNAYRKLAIHSREELTRAMSHLPA